jgi:circadian clock protein KaiC
MQGYFRGGSLLASGTAGTGKSSIASHFADAACRRGEHCIYFALEESPDQVVRNMRSIGIDLGSWAEKGLLHFAAFRPSTFGLEVHLSTMLKRIDEIKPRVVIADPVSSFMAAGTDLDARSMLMRMIDLLKTRQITALLTSLTSAGHPVEQSEVGISSLIDTWLMLRNSEQAGERSRTPSIIKSRGMKLNQARELLLTGHGVDLAEVFTGPDGDILTGSRRVAQETADQTAAAALEDEIASRQAALLRRRKAAEARIAEMQADIAAEAEEVGAAIRLQTSTASGLAMARLTQAQEREQAGAPQSVSLRGARR